jgi:hypothetical protein
MEVKQAIRDALDPNYRELRAMKMAIDPRRKAQATRIRNKARREAKERKQAEKGGVKWSP